MIKPIKILLLCFLLTISLLAVGNGNIGNKYFGGIEVGSKGVKLVILEILDNYKLSTSYKTLKDSSINTDFISFTDITNTNTINALTILYNYANNEFGISKSNIFIAISSGVHTIAKRDNKYHLIGEMTDAFLHSIKEQKRNIEIITPEMESELTFVSLIPTSTQFETLVLDFGSGNVKGGYFNEDDLEFVPCYSNWGTKSITNSVLKILPKIHTIELFYRVLDSITNKIQIKEINPLVNSRSGFSEKRNILCGGGISWAINNMMAPDQSKKDFSKLNLAFMYNLRAKLKDNFNTTNLNPELFYPKYYSEEQKKIAKENLSTVFKVYDTKSLIAGTELVIKFLESLTTLRSKTNINVTQMGKLGWLPGYIILKTQK